MAESRRRHPCWKYVTLLDKDNTNNTTCIFCEREIKGGIYRHTEHIIGGQKNVRMCPTAPKEVRDELRDYFNKKKAEKEGYNMLGDFSSVDLIDDDDDDDDDCDDDIQVGGKRKIMSSGGGSSTASAKTLLKKKQPRQRGPMDKFLTPNPQYVGRDSKKMKQTSISEAYNKEGADLVRQYMARFIYDNSIAFNVVRSESFRTMVEAIANFGPGIKPITYHQVRGPYLKKEYANTQNLMKTHEESWGKFGCTIMSDGWTDRRDMTLINFLVNTPNGTMFLESVDASSDIKTGEKMCELLSKIVDQVGAKNVIQVTTDNASNLVLAGKLLEAKYPHIYWTPCAAHCLDLMLEDIGKMPRVKRALQRAMAVNGFIYNHPYVLNMMREFTKGQELLRPAVTRFATCFLTLQSIHKQKNNLRAMFVSEKWMSNRWAKEQKGKRVTSIMMMTSFWNDVVYILKATGPLVRVLRLVDSEKVPAMGYIYEAMDRAKEAIKKAFNDDERKYEDVFDIIDRRWDIQLHKPLHAAGYFLNPAFSYDNNNLEYDLEVMNGLHHVINKLEPDIVVQDKIDNELKAYRNAKGLFGLEKAIRQRKIRSPVDWWTSFGAQAPNLQRLAIKVLGLTCSASGCERNWSMFEHIHSKRRNRLEQKRLNDLVYIKYNRALKARWDKREKIDPLSLKDIDECNEWLVGRMGNNSGIVEEVDEDFVFEGDDLTWDMVGRASGAEEAVRNLRSSHSNIRASNSRKKVGASSSRPPLSLHDIDEVEANSEESEEDYGVLDGYESKDDGEEVNEEEEEPFDEEDDD